MSVGTAAGLHEKLVTGINTSADCKQVTGCPLHMKGVDMLLCLVALLLL